MAMLQPCFACGNNATVSESKTMLEHVHALQGAVLSIKVTSKGTHAEKFVASAARAAVWRAILAMLPQCSGDNSELQTKAEHNIQFWQEDADFWLERANA